ncbi:CHAP domain-containing protein [Mycobacterium sp. OTB74]|jgi:uncharacterized protein YukE|uniref:CHAP domain-containing protein n=1 Tax=Mycobacterium sp. OTB74 TaxID=1853452 RepID=UPI00247677C2|nr:CHAP domain-containing protein [Mycobacterium sp. OTB74]MDH6246236.1 uncharacterized protein YukE [Mycobacterium sp. OTB74]
MAELGMDAGLVEQAGRQLKSHAASIQSLIAQVDKTVNGLASIWQGQDATQFVTQWWPQHKKSLQAAQQQVDGLGQSALNNASEQRQASSGGSGGAVSSASPAHAASPASSSGASAATAAGSTAPAAGARSEAVDRFVQSHKTRMDADGNGAWCYDIYKYYSHDVAGAPLSIGSGTSANASDIYNMYSTNGASKYYDQIPASSGHPEPGDIIVYGSTKDNSYGHVALVTGVDGSGYSVLQQGKVVNGQPMPSDPYTQRYGYSSTASGPVLGYLRPKQVASA